MHKSWNFNNPVHVHFGPGCRRLLADQLSGKECLVITTKRGHSNLLSDSILSSLPNHLSIKWMDSVVSHPAISDLQESIDNFNGSTFDAIIAYGGGSVIDSAKVISLALSPDLRGIPLIDLLANPRLYKNAKTFPLFALTTTAGTGSEVTPFSTIWDYENYKKYSFSGPSVYAYSAIVDPELTYDLPEDVTITTGLDAINQSLESIWNHNATSLTLGIASSALNLGFKALPKLCLNGFEEKYRDNMAECSLLAGLAISQTRTALCHSISYPLTSHFNVPHGLACAFTMLEVFRLNRCCDDGRLKQLAEHLGCKSCDELEEQLSTLLKVLNVTKKVLNYLPSFEVLKAMIGEMQTKERAGNNLAPVNRDVICRILENSYNQI